MIQFAQVFADEEMVATLSRHLAALDATLLEIIPLKDRVPAPVLCGNVQGRAVEAVRQFDGQKSAESCLNGRRCHARRQRCLSKEQAGKTDENPTPDEVFSDPLLPGLPRLERYLQRKGSLEDGLILSELEHVSSLSSASGLLLLPVRSGSE